MQKLGAHDDDDGYLDGHLLIAVPALSDPRFQRCVIYLCAHSADGAMGLIINQRAPGLSFGGLLDQLDLDLDPAPEDAQRHVLIGGPVEAGRGFVLHTADYFLPETTLPIDDDVCLTATIEILKAMAKGRGPRRALLALGYAAWAPGQLEDELQGNSWLVCPADGSIVFDAPLPAKYSRAMARLGVDPSFLVGDVGHA